MRGYPLDIRVLSDKKSINIQPYVTRKNGGLGQACNIDSKLKYSCSNAELGKSVFDGFDYIIGKYERDEDIDEQNEKLKSIPWTKRGTVFMSKDKDGNYTLEFCYVNHVVMTTETVISKKLTSNITAEEMGREVKSAFEFVFDYALRQEICVFYSEKEGLYFVPCAMGTTGYVYADFCIKVDEPYSPKEIRAAAEKAFDYATENPKDKRTIKERKQNLPWREFSKYKSLNSFVKSHRCIEMHRLTDGRLVFIPSESLYNYDSDYVNYECLQTVKNGDISDKELKDEIFDTLERSRLINEKSEEYNDYKRFVEYVKSIAAQLEGRQF